MNDNTKWITDKEPTWEDGDSAGNVIIALSNGSVKIEKFNKVVIGTPWIKPPQTPKEISTRWKYGTQPNIITDGEHFVVVSGGTFKVKREEIIEICLETLNRRLS